MNTLPHRFLTTGMSLAMLALWPAADFGSEPSPPEIDKVVCIVNDVEIKEAEVQAALQALLPTARYHAAVSPQSRKELSLQAFRNVVDSELKYQDALRRGLRMDEQNMSQAVQVVRDRYPSQAAFRKALRRNGLGLDGLKRYLARPYLAKEVEDLVGGPERDVGTDEARRYYEENPDRFRQPRSARIDYVLVKVPPVPRTPQVWDAAEAQARSAKTRLQAGTSPPEVAKQVSTEELTAVGATLGTVHQGQLQHELDAVIWDLPEGGISEPLRGFEGIYILRVDDLFPARLVPFEDLEQKLRRELQSAERRGKQDRWLEQLRDDARIKILDDYYRESTQMSDR